MDVPVMESPGALEWTVIPLKKLPVTVLPLTWCWTAVAPGALVATTIWPITGPWGPNMPGAPWMWLLLTVVPLTPAPGTHASMTMAQPPKLP